MKLRLIIILLLTGITNFAMAQGSGGLIGKVIDAKGESVPFASVGAFEGGILKGQAKTDFNGNYKIKPLASGSYTIKISSVGFDKIEISGVLIRSNNITTKNVTMQLKGGGKGTVTKVLRITATPPIIDPTDPGGTSVSGKAIAGLAAVDPSKALVLVSGLDNGGSEGGGVSIGGGRNNETMYLIDGMMVRGGDALSNLPPDLIRDIVVFKSGVPAKVGNATGGVIEVNTINMSSKFRGGIRGQHSIDGFNNNYLNFNLAGPLLFKNDSTTGRRPVLGFVLSLSGRYNKDNNPSFVGYPSLKADVLSEIQENPLMANPLATGNALFIPRAESITADDYTTIRARDNGESYNVNYLGKIDFAPTSRMNVRLGTYFDYNRARNWSFANALFAPDANSTSNRYTARGFLQLQQSLGKPNANESAVISDAFYNIQLSYQRAFNKTENPVHKDDIFKYGYLGKFDQQTTPFYRPDTFTAPSGAVYQGWRFIGNGNTGLVYTPSGDNPLLENYTKQVFDGTPFDITNQSVLQALRGLRNGDAPRSAYQLWTGPGSQITSYGYGQTDQFDLTLGASFDINQGIKNKANKELITHQIEFGLGYQQITNRGYSIGANRLGNLWSQMRLITNNHIQNLDVSNPIFVVGGNEYTEEQLIQSGLQFSDFDTVRFNNFVAASDQTRFSKELRRKLFNDETNADVIYTDNLDPSTFTLDMFSADDLYNDGNLRFVNYRGYDYLGNIQRNQPNFNDFWTKRDSRGDYLRPIAPYNPNYMFGYISDLFTYKDVVFNVGVRIDRFDANQNVLRDPYSLYGTRELSSIDPGAYRLAFDQGTNKTAPDPKSAGFSGDWIPYVDNNQASTPTLVGYRDGNAWYDPFGKQVTDPTTLSEDYANGLPIQPWLTDRTDSIKSEGYKINNAFTDYQPDIAISPRIRFTFPITDQALFFGNYDIMTQYPQGNNFVSPDNYYFFNERNFTATNPMSNANLRMQRTINYRLGFEQAVTEKSKIGIEAYYNERKGLIQLQQFILAYPRTYVSYGNRDFSSTKGFTFSYKLRKTKELPLSMSIAYTLQFAEGSGSDAQSLSSFIRQEQPNLRTVFPMNFDTRHIGSVNLDYDFGLGYDKGPKIGKNEKAHYLLSGVSMNLLLTARSGRPYTQTTQVIRLQSGGDNIPISGGFNGTRRPWTNNVDFRINKSLTFFRVGKKKDGDGKVLPKSGKRVGGSVYVYFENLLNTRNVIGVYQYTGLPDDDGYIASPLGQQELNTSIIFNQSYTDLYNTRINSPFNFNNPRRAYVGFSMNF